MAGQVANVMCRFHVLLQWGGARSEVQAHLAGDDGLDVEAEHGEHGQTAVLDLLGLQGAKLHISACFPLSDVRCTRARLYFMTGICGAVTCTSGCCSQGFQ